MRSITKYDRRSPSERIKIISKSGNIFLVSESDGKRLVGILLKWNKNSRNSIVMHGKKVWETFFKTKLMWYDTEKEGFDFSDL